MQAIAKLAAINLITFLLLLVFIEFLIHLSLQNPSFIPRFLLNAYRHYYRTMDRNIIQVTDCAHYDSSLFYILKPGRCTFSNREFNTINHINSMGLRDDEESLQNPAIIVLGDSYSLGWGVQQEENFAQLLEKLSGQLVLNAGMSSYGTAREIKLLEGLDISAVRFIIIQYHGNDHSENLTAQKNDYILPISSRESYDSLKKNIAQRSQYFPFKNLYGISKSFAKSFIAHKASEAFAPVEEAKVFLDILLHSKINLNGIRFFVFKADNYRYLSDDFADAVDSLLQTPDYSGLKIKTIRLSDTLSKDDYFILDDHINAEGHRKIAIKLSENLKKENKSVVKDQ